MCEISTVRSENVRLIENAWVSREMRETWQVCRGLIKSYRTFRSAESPANSDHVLLVAELSLTLLKPRIRPPLCHGLTSLALSRMLNSRTSTIYNITVQNKFASLGALPDDVEESWISFSRVIRSFAEEVIGPARRSSHHNVSYQIYSAPITKRT